jgi:hemoglobin
MNPIFISLLLLQAIPEVEGESTELSEQIEIIEEKPDPVTGEFAVDPYPQTNENAGAKPFGGANMSIQFGGKDGIRKITDRLVDLSIDDPRISEIFKGQDMVRLRRTLFEQFCYILAAGCDYSGRDMRSAHADMGLERNDLNALVENLQKAMAEQKIPFSAQNRLLAKLAPMERAVLQK